ncbi:OLC1v1033733C3 [Oldenlandia corymbosa var. corymbosa]|nr:OLC1v1033733C3 [Oldenlandia corymbosa var. corymbosa]
MMYLTDVWKLPFTDAAVILNLYYEVSAFLPLLLQFLVDTLMGNFWMLLISSLAYSMGLVFLAMSTPPLLSKVTGSCSSYEPECIGDAQRVLFYTALAFIAVGTAGHTVSLSSFVEEQGQDADSAPDNVTFGSIIEVRVRKVVGFGIPCFAVLGFPYIKPWSLHFGIPAIFSVVATLIFMSGSSSYTCVEPQGSPLTMVMRVFVAAASKNNHPHPYHSQLNGMANSEIPHTCHPLRCLNKAALVLPNQSLEEQQNNRWKLCTVAEVEYTKHIVRWVPMAISFMSLGLLISLGVTFFVEQAKHMNHKAVGSLTVPLTIFWWITAQARSIVPGVYYTISVLSHPNEVTRHARAGTKVSMLIGILCCLTAAKVESHRLERNHPISVFWLLPQFILLGATQGMYESGLALTSSQIFRFRPHLAKFMALFTSMGINMGFIGSIIAINVLGKVTKTGGKQGWFQDTLNHSRLDNYYYFLAGLCAANLVLYYMVWKFCRGEDDS